MDPTVRAALKHPDLETAIAAANGIWDRAKHLPGGQEPGVATWDEAPVYIRVLLEALTVLAHDVGVDPGLRWDPTAAREVAWETYRVMVTTRQDVETCLDEAARTLSLSGGTTE